MAANGTRPLVDRMTAPRWGVSIPLDEDTEGFRSDEPKNFLSKFHIKYKQVRVYRDDTLLTNEGGNLRFRYGVAATYLHGRSGDITVGDLKQVSPELVEFANATPKLLEFNSTETKIFNAVGQEILDGEIVPSARVTGLGLAVFAGMSVAGGHYVLGDGWHLFAAEFTLGIAAGPSMLRLTVTERDESRSDTMYGWSAAPIFALGLAKICEQTTGTCLTPSMEMQIGIVHANDKTRAILVPVIFQITLDTAMIEAFFDPRKHPL